jgi:Zn-dependent protease with chaperone function
MSVVLLVLVGVVLTACAARYPQEWVTRQPRRAARVIGATLTAGTAFCYLGLSLWALPAAVVLVPQIRLPAACRRVLIDHHPGGPAAPWLAAAIVVLSVGMAGARVRHFWRARRTLHIDGDVGIRVCLHGLDVVYLPVATPLAYSLSGSRAQIVISQGLHDRLDSAGLAAVVAHERAHLQGRHDRWLEYGALLEVALWFAPWTRRATAAVRLALECRADDEAVRTVGSGAVIAGLLAAVDASPVPAPAVALSGVEALAERVTRLRTLGADPSPLVGAGGLRRYVLHAGVVASGGAGLVAAASLLAHLCVG